jgi:glucose/arabinose dehydrogenase
VTLGENNKAFWARELDVLYGKVLRINPADGSAPLDNPFYDDGDPTTGNDDRIWAYGL